MYEAVTVYPEGTSTLSRIGVTAQEFGFDGIVVKNSTQVATDVGATEVPGEASIDFVRGASIRVTDPSRDGGRIASLRPEVTVLCATPTDEQTARFIVGQSKVDVLGSPIGLDNRLPHSVVSEAAAKKVAIELDFGAIVRSTGKPRRRAIDRLTDCAMLIEQYNAPVVTTVGAQSHLELRGVREIRALATEIGITQELVDRGFETWGELAAKHRHSRDDTFIEPGVELVGDETDCR